MDQLYTWGWPQWVAIATLAVGTFVTVREAVAPGLVIILLWTVILAAGGFWS